MIVSCGAKDKSLTLARMDTGAVELVKVNGALNI